ncbi:MAG: glutamine--fructose-6-phosphate transaminase (isomerizing) [Eubacteriales bacterium]|nr:glutamine--fructose-6-phosphate transaminase (isomerizing) [Eubacteriales bacterium]
MCGIVGYVGSQKATPILLDGLSKLEYRGYDSAGVAVHTGVAAGKESIRIEKSMGRLEVLSRRLDGGEALEGTMGIGHTRWATHGGPSDVNSHPHRSRSGKYVIVHNGIIENYLQQKTRLIGHGYEFVSDTDSEVIAHLMEYYEHKYGGDVLDTLAKTISRLEGSFALGILCSECPDKILAVRKESPLIVGLGEDGNYIASDVPAILKYTREIYYLENSEIVVLSADDVSIYNVDKEPVAKQVCHIDWDVSAAEKGGYEHFMFKEIMEQPRAIRDTISPRIRDGGIQLDTVRFTAEEIRGIRKIVVLACGSAYHVGMVGKYIIEKAARIPVEVVLASEFRYCGPIVGADTLAIVISQSGETADTLAAMREAKRLGARILSVVNVVGSSIAKESDDLLYTWAGPEIAVATTKAYSTQLSVMYLIALFLAQHLGTMPADEFAAALEGLRSLPDKIEQVLDNKEQVQYLASLFFNSKDVFFIGRNTDYAMSLEGSLKLKEISYIHSEAYAAGELKHGTISLIEEGTLVVALATNKALFDKMMSNVKEVKARGAVVLGLTVEGFTNIEREADHSVYLPEIYPMFYPSLAVLPLQLFSYYIAAMKGCDIDKPRNLAKSVTVE